MTRSAALFAVITVAVVSLVVVAVRSSARRAGLPVADVGRVTRTVALSLAGWLGLLAVGAGTGFLSNFDARPPRMMLVLLGSIALFVAALRTPTLSRLLAATPRTWPIAVQAMRVPIELGLWSLFLEGRMPEHMTFEGRNLDVLVGLTAPLVAVSLARGWIGARGAIAWNVASLCLLANVVGMAITTMPGPLHLAWPGVSNVVVAELPFVFLPGLLVPVALFGHVLSLRQLLGRRATRPEPLAG